VSKLQNKVKLHFKFPLAYNDGTKVPDKEFRDAKNYFIDTYEGLTVSGTSTGYWKHSGLLYADETVEYFVLIENGKFSKKVKPKLNSEIDKFRRKFRQIEILCYYHNVMST
jgi:hypothetical protein